MPSAKDALLYACSWMQAVENEISNIYTPLLRKFQDSLAVQQAPKPTVTPNEDKSAGNAAS